MPYTLTRTSSILIASAILVACAVVYAATLPGESIITVINSRVATSLPSRTATMLFVGDIMLSRSVGARMQELGDYTYPFRDIAETLRDADITFANLENPVSARGVNVGSKY